MINLCLILQVAAALREMRRVDEEMKRREKSMIESSKEDCPSIEDVEL